MAEQVRKEKPPKVTNEEAQEIAERDAEVQAARDREADLAATDELLDEIDSLLEENAQEFVQNYIQKGGQ